MKIFTFSKDSVKKLLIVFSIFLIISVILSFMACNVPGMYGNYGVFLFVLILCFITYIIAFLLLLQFSLLLSMKIVEKINFKHKKAIQIILTIFIQGILAFILFIILGILLFIFSGESGAVSSFWN